MYFDAQRALPVSYDGVMLDCGYRLDLVVDRQVVVEVKSVKTLAPIYTAQILTYLKLTGCPVGLLIKLQRAAAEGRAEACHQSTPTRRN